MRFISLDDIIELAKQHKLATNHVEIAALLSYTFDIERLVRERALEYNQMKGISSRDMTRILGDI
jgi:hypothetical protein